MNIALKMEILKRFRCQADFAVAVNEHETKVSQIIRGRRMLNPVDAERWLNVLKCSPDIIAAVTRGDEACNPC
jgi:hypothetical protein